MTSKTFAEKIRVQSKTLTDREREAAAILYEDGWSIPELQMTMQAGERAIRAAIKNAPRGGSR